MSCQIPKIILSALLVVGFASECYSQQVGLPEPENVTAVFASSTTILWSWDVPETSLNLTGFMIYCRVERSKVIYSYEPDRRNILCDDLKPYFVYTLFVSTFMDDPLTGKRSFSKPGFQVSRTNSAAPPLARNLNVTFDEESNALNVTWETPDPWNGQLDGHIIKIKNSNGDVIYEETKRLFNNKLLFNLPLTPSEYYDVSVQYFNVDQNTGLDLFGETLTTRFLPKLVK